MSLSVLSSFLAPNPPKRDGAAGVVEAGGVLEGAGASGFLPNNPAPAPKTEPPVEAAGVEDEAPASAGFPNKFGVGNAVVEAG